MTAFNARIEPKLYLGILPKYTLGGLFIALPTFVIGILTEIFILKWLLIIVAGLSVVIAVVFLVIGRDAPFVVTMIKSSSENNNVTVETWTKE